MGDGNSHVALSGRWFSINWSERVFHFHAGVKLDTSTLGEEDRLETLYKWCDEQYVDLRQKT